MLEKMVLFIQVTVCPFCKYGLDLFCFSSPVPLVRLLFLLPRVLLSLSLHASAVQRANLSSASGVEVDAVSLDGITF